MAATDQDRLTSGETTSIRRWHADSQMGTDLRSHDLFTSHAWLSIVQETYGFPILIAEQECSGENLPIALLDDLAGRRMMCMPFSDYASPSAGSRSVRRLFDSVLGSYPTFRQIISSPLDDVQSWQSEGWELTSEAVGHRVLITSEEGLWRNLSQGFRNQIRQAQKRGVTISHDASVEAMGRFYALHAYVRNRKFTSLPQPKLFFDKVYEHKIASGEGLILEAIADSDVVASCVALRHGTTIYYKFSASDLRAYELRANNLMLWELLRTAATEQCDVLDLGRSGKGESYAGLRHFKEGLGAETFPIRTFVRNPIAESAENLMTERDFRALVGDLSKRIAQGHPSTEENDRMSSLLYRFFA